MYPQENVESQGLGSVSRPKDSCYISLTSKDWLPSASEGLHLISLAVSPMQQKRDRENFSVMTNYCFLFVHSTFSYYMFCVMEATTIPFDTE